MEIVGIFNKIMKEDFELDPDYKYVDTKNAYGPAVRYECTLRVPGIEQRITGFDLTPDKATEGCGQKKKDAQQNACREYAEYLIQKGVVPMRKFPGLMESGQTLPIEVKSAIYSAFGRRKWELPTYEITENGGLPHERVYFAKMRIPTINYVTVGTASNKKDAETEAAWIMSKFLVERCILEKNELPPAPPGFVPIVPKTALFQALINKYGVVVILQRAAEILTVNWEPQPQGTLQINFEKRCKMALKCLFCEIETKGSGKTEEEAETMAAWEMAKKLVEENVLMEADLLPLEFPAEWKPRDRLYYSLNKDLQSLVDDFSSVFSGSKENLSESGQSSKKSTKSGSGGKKMKQVATAQKKGFFG